MLVVNTRGKILNGQQKGWYIYIVDDRENTGGYLLLESESSDIFGSDGEGFDTWYETLYDIERQLINNAWSIDWDK